MAISERKGEGRSRALAMFSGGLDSAVAVKLMIDQGVPVTALHFVTPFMSGPFQAETPKEHIRAICEQLGVDLVVVPVVDDYIEMLRRPRYGYGKNLNPCVDCKILFLRRAREMMAGLGAGFVVTGEVLGQRPMSQRRDAMNAIERESGLRGLLLRPLSAGLLPPTVPEEKGWVDRKRLLDIGGRGRKRQIAIAEAAGISGYSSPSGGCLLTDKEHSRKVRYLLDRNDEISLADLELLKCGRHFLLDSSARVVVARNEGENKVLLAMRGAATWIFTPVNFPGPVALAIGDMDEGERMFAARLVARYGSARRTAAGAIVQAEMPGRSEGPMLLGPVEPASDQQIYAARF